MIGAGTKRGPVKRYTAPNRLAILVARDGGLWREEAIVAAERNVESIRDSSMAALDALILEIAGRGPEGLDAVGRCAWLERTADRIITLSETYGLAHLSNAAKRLCDLVSVMREQQRILGLPLAVHLNAVRLFAPHNPRVEDEAAERVLAELWKVLDFLDFMPMPEPRLD